MEENTATNEKVFQDRIYAVCVLARRRQRDSKGFVVALAFLWLDTVGSVLLTLVFRSLYHGPG